MSETRHTVDPKFVMKRQGKDMVLYAGLVDAAHRAGLLGISTEILQFPTKDNDQTTIVRAVATFPVTWMESPETGDEIAVSAKRFTGIGDANPKNVGPNIVLHAIRMAETRAKARALRDALNVGMVTVEELGGDDDGHSAAQPRQTAAPRQPPAPQPHAQQRPVQAVTEADTPAPPESLTDAQEKIIAGIRDEAEGGLTYAAAGKKIRDMEADATPGQWTTIKQRFVAIRRQFYPDTLKPQAERNAR